MTPIPVGPFEFYEPGRLWALLTLPVLLALYIIVMRLRKNRGIRYTNTGIVAAVLPKQSQWRRHVAVVMTLASLTLIVGAWARPVGIDRVPRERATVVVVLDTSLSMEATDVSPDRFEAEKAAAKEFIANLPAKFNVAVVQLSGNARIVVNPGDDRGIVDGMIDRLQLEDGTAIGRAIDVSLSAIAAAPGDEGSDPPPAMIILLSDGQNTSGDDPMVAAQQAADQKVPIHTIAFGTDNGYVDLDGKRENVAPDRELLRNISNLTGGRAVDARDAAQLQDVYGDLRSEVGTEEVRKEITSRWVMYALAFAVVASLGAVSMAARWP